MKSNICNEFSPAKRVEINRRIISAVLSTSSPKVHQASTYSGRTNNAAIKETCDARRNATYGVEFQEPGSVQQRCDVSSGEGTLSIKSEAGK